METVFVFGGFFLFFWYLVFCCFGVVAEGSGFLRLHLSALYLFSAMILQ